MKNILVLGIGNILLSDEGAGVRAIEFLNRHYEIPPVLTLVDAGTMGLEILPYLEGKTDLIIVDAVVSDKQPGHVLRKKLNDAGVFFRNKISPHQLGLSEVLGAATLTGCLPPEIVLLGIVPKKLDAGLEFSSEIDKAFPHLIDQLIEEIQSRGICLCPKILPCSEGEAGK
jgi:hydrogenase maturation protease